MTQHIIAAIKKANYSEPNPTFEEINARAAGFPK